MYWLWIPAVSLLAVFLLALCWYFFSDYTCCPCQRNRSSPSSLPVTVHDTDFSRESNRHFEQSGEQFFVTPTKQPVRSVPSAPFQTPEESPLIKLKFGDKKLTSVIFEQDGVPTIDLHGMTVLEARFSVQGFIQRQRSLGVSVTRIITGRGVHSGGEAKVKPAIRNVLLAEGVNFMEINKGGAYKVYL